MRVIGHTCSCTVILAVAEDPPSPAVRPGPIHGMGTAVRCRAQSVTGTASATNNAADEHFPTSARTIFARPVQVDEAESARDTDHDDMRFMRQRNWKVKRAHLPGLIEMFERTSIDLLAHLLFVDVKLSVGAHLSRLGYPLKLLEPRVSSLPDTAHQHRFPNLLQNAAASCTL